MNSVVVGGLDFAIQKTGVAYIDSTGRYRTKLIVPQTSADGRRAKTMKSMSLDDRTDYVHARLANIRSQLEVWVLESRVDLVVMEKGIIARMSGAHELAGAWWMMKHHLWVLGVPVVTVIPTRLKLFLAGSGGASKAQMKAGITAAFPSFRGDDNEADALGLAVMGAAHLGLPHMTLTDAQQDALDATEWPKVRGMKT